MQPPINLQHAWGFSIYDGHRVRNYRATLLHQIRICDVAIEMSSRMVRSLLDFCKLRAYAHLYANRPYTYVYIFSSMLRRNTYKHLLMGRFVIQI